MGNTSSAFSSAATVDFYIAELGDISFEKSLSSSRFLKCIRGRHRDGKVVVKIFVKAGNINLKNQIKQLQVERDLLLNVPNALSYQRFQETERAGYLVRQHIASNLYDRISTRPFLETVEKRWIVFQLLSGLRDCHNRGIRHGDIKTENVLVTSWNWVYLTDFAFFKPTYLPENNPADFSYYFDTSFRRTCYLAPERFTGLSEEKTGAVTDSMDIFSLGCVIAELFLEGTPLFDLSQLFKYKIGEYNPSSVLERIDDLEIRSMITHMVSLDPDKRYTAENYLQKWRHRAFPSYFTTFLHEYIASITEAQRHHLHSPSPDIDDELDRIFFEFDQISFFLGFDDKTKKAFKPEHPKQDLMTSLSIPNYQPANVDGLKRASGEDGALVFLSILLTGVRNTIRPTTRVRACDTILALSERISDEAKLDRVVPFLIALMTDSCADVRCGAIRALVQVLSQVRVLTPLNAFIFPEYVLPRLTAFTSDPSDLVRIAYAQTISKVAATAASFLDMAQALRAEGFLTLVDANEAESGPSDEDSFTVLLEIGRKDQERLIHEHVVAFLTDPNTSVKRSLLDSIVDLSVIFGRPWASDIVLSHLITYLNDRDWLLKAAFFQNIVGLSSYLGRGAVEEYVVPLMIQSLSDPEDFIVENVLEALSKLCKHGLIGRDVGMHVMHHVISFLVHPNLWIQEAVAGFIAAASADFVMADVHCLVYPILRPFLRHEIGQVSALLILQALRRPLAPAILEQAFKWAAASSSHGSSLFWVPSTHRRSSSANGNNKSKQHMLPPPLLLSNSVESKKAIHTQRIPQSKLPVDELHSTKLRTLGLRAEDEWKLICLKEYIWQVSHIRLEAERITHSNDLLPDPKNNPTTIFFDHTAVENVSSARSVHAASHDVQTVLRNASRNLEDFNQTRGGRRISSLPYAAQNRNASLSKPNGDTVNRSQTPLATAFPGDTKPPSVDRATAVSSRKTSLNGENKMVPVRSSLAVNLPGISSKASAAISTTTTIAVGQVDHNCHSDLLSANETEQSVPTRASHTYTGSDPNVLRVLEKVYVDNYPETVGGFGPSVVPIPPRAVNNRDTGSSWKPDGTLVLHVQEHTAAITCVKVSPDHVFFVTSSDDGTIKVWDSGKLEKNVANRARMTYRGMNGSKIKTLCFLENSYCIAAASDQGAIHIIKIGCSTTSGGTTKFGEMQAIRHHQLEDGEIATCMEHYVQDQTSTLLIATNKCRIFGLDLRSMNVSYELQNPPHHGHPTSFCTDKKKTWLLVGTSRGILDMWDLRFRLRLKSLGLPQSSRVTSLHMHPNRGRGRWVTVATAANEEMTVWDIEKSVCREVYRPHGRQPRIPNDNYRAWEIDESKPEEILARFTNEISVSALQEASSSHHSTSVKAMGVVAAEAAHDGSSQSKSHGVYFLSASSDQKLRLWDINKVESSCVLSGARPEEEGLVYRLTVHGSLTLFEEAMATAGGTTTTSSTPRRGARSSREHAMAATSQQNQILMAHMDTILDVAYLQYPYRMVISVDRSGVLKVFA